MKRNVLFTLLAISLTLTSNAQISSGGEPYSSKYQLSMSGVNQISLAELSIEQIEQEDALRAANGEMPLYSRNIPVDINIHALATWQSIPEGRIGRLKLVIPGAKANELFFEDFFIPNGGSMFIYDEKKKNIIGSFTAFNNKVNGRFATSLIPGEVCIVELFEPSTAIGAGRSVLGLVGHAYRMVEFTEAKADPCQVDVNCSEGADWVAQRDGVVRISVQNSQGSGWCTGSIVNNTNYDCKPYILSAWHCADASTASHFDNFKFYFRFHRTGCATGIALSGKVMTGCTKIADSEISGSNDGSDFLLMELDNQIPDNFTPFFAGWSIQGSTSTSGVCIHHPAGSEKKISTYTQALSSTTWPGTPTQFHWRVFWTGTANGHGVTEGGSSGSPIFDDNGLIIGTLTGGASFCNQIQPGGQNQPDFYGKMDKHWDDNGTTSNRQLEPWLDPAGTGMLTVQGDYNPCGTYSVFTGVEEQEVLQLEVFPNPVDDLLTLKMPEDIRVNSIEIRDVTGKLFDVWNAPEGGLVNLQVKDLPNGSYALSAITENSNRLTARFLVVH